jgi:hypothetical protein
MRPIRSIGEWCSIKLFATTRSSLALGHWIEHSARQRPEPRREGVFSNPRRPSLWRGQRLYRSSSRHPITPRNRRERCEGRHSLPTPTITRINEVPGCESSMRSAPFRWCCRCDSSWTTQRCNGLPSVTRTIPAAALVCSIVARCQCVTACSHLYLFAVHQTSDRRPFEHPVLERCVVLE